MIEEKEEEDIAVSLKAAGLIGNALFLKSVAMDSRFSLKGTQPNYAPDRTFITEHIRLDLNLNIAREILEGRSRTTLRAIVGGAAEMTFDAVNFQINEVRWNGRKIPPTYKDGKLTLAPKTRLRAGARVIVDINYRVVRPKLGIYFLKPTRRYPQRPTQVWTQGEDEYARYWFPCHDAPHERTTSEVIATVPRGFTAVSNGALVKTTQNQNRTTTFHWKQDIPHAPYLVTLTVGRFSVLQEEWRKIPVQYYCEKGREEEARRAFGKTPKMLEFFSKSIGVSYPYAKYAQIAVADFIYGGLENTSATTQTDNALLDERASLDTTSDELVAHELAHQWFGDYLTCKDWSHAWLNESFATYFDALFKRHDKGVDEYLYQIRANSEVYFAEDKDHYRRPIVTRMFRRPTDLFDRHLYEKGSVVLYMLHRILGETLFWKSIHTYVKNNRGRVVETPELINAVEEATGRNMRRFFDQWVYGAGHPEFKIRAWWDRRKRQIYFRVVQTQAQDNETGLFFVDTEFLVQGNRGESRWRVRIDKKAHLFQFPLAEEPQLILFDPDHAVLKKVDFPRSEEALITQLQKDKSPLGRIEAAHLVAKTGSRAAREALRKALLKEDFWGVRAEVASALGSSRSEAALAPLKEALEKVDHPKIRRAGYAALRQIKGAAMPDIVKKFIGKEKSYFAEAEGLRALGAFERADTPKILKEALKKDSWNDVTRSAALEGLAATGSREWIPLLVSYTQPGHSQKLRLAAVRCLVSLGAGSEQVRSRLLELLHDAFLLVRIAAVRGLHEIGDERAVPALKKLTTGDLDGRLKRLSEEAIEKITKGFE